MKLSPLLNGSLALLLACPAFAASAPTPAPVPRAEAATPRFTDPDRRARVNALLPEIDHAFAAYAEKKKYPGLVWGLVLDGELIHTGALGFANVEKKIPATAAGTRFRIASMTKSFTALAILQLRDAGKLRLTDPVVAHLPEFAAVQALTEDAPAITVHHLLTMTAGFPEDNPWGDRQLALPPADLRAFLRRGIALSNAPGLAFEYSNLAYALLGEIITVVAGEPYQRYITRNLLAPLGMRDTRWEYTEVPADRLALGYRNGPQGWVPEPMLHDGSYGAMGGLLTTVEDLARYLRLHLQAWPARTGIEPRAATPDFSRRLLIKQGDWEGRNGAAVASRATLREMHLPGVITRMIPDAKNLAGEITPQVVGYGYGWRWTLDTQGVTSVGHSGGLPGFGSHHVFFPEYGFAILSFANLTYAGTSAVNAQIAALLLEKAKLPRRTLPPSPILATRTPEIARLVQTWDETLAAALVAENFFLDRSRVAWREFAGEILAQAGKITAVGAIVPENQLRGTFALQGEKGRVEVFYTLTPEADPRLQELSLKFVATPSSR